MTEPSRSSRSPKAAAPEAPALGPAAACAVALLVPGAAHLLLGQARKAVVFFGVLLLMFTTGLLLGGRLFRVDLADPLLFLAALAQWALAVPHALAGFAGAGRGDVVAVTYEFGNTYLIAGGLLNVLVTLDAFDLATGRKAR